MQTYAERPGFDNHTCSGRKTMQTWKDADQYLGSKGHRPLTGRATDVRRLDDGSIAVRYHQTDVVVYLKSNKCVLDSGGWLTLTTKERINSYSPASLYQRWNTWYLRDGSLFYDGMVVKSDGTAVKPKLATSIEKYAKAYDKIVKAYVDGFIEDIRANGLRLPGGGDCWGCCLQVSSGGTPGPHGRVEPMGIDHYLSHFAQGYYVPSILTNALVVEGRTHEQVCRILGMTKSDLESVRIGWDYHVRRALCKFFRKLRPALLKKFINLKGKLPKG